MMLGLSASLLAGSVARFLQPHPGPRATIKPKYHNDTLMLYIPYLTGWRAIPVRLTEKRTQLSREPKS